MQNNSKTPFYFILLIIVCSCMSAFFVYFPITNTDIWWHLAAGREIVSQKNFLYSDSFAYTLISPQWIDLHWLFQVVVYGFYIATGFKGLVFAKCLVVGVLCFFTTTLNQSIQYKLFASAMFTLLIFEVRYLVLVRPVIISLFCIIVFIYAFEKYRIKRQSIFIWILLPVQILWTNSQGLFVLGPIIALCYLLGEGSKNIWKTWRLGELKERWFQSIPWFLFIAVLVLSVSCMVNPYGLDGVLLPLKLFGRIDPALKNIYAYNISENLPFFSLRGQEIHYLYSMIATTAITLILFLLNYRKFNWSQLLLFFVFCYLAVIAKRNILLYFVIIPIVSGCNFNTLCREAGKGKKPKISSLYAIVTAGIISGLLIIGVAIHIYVVSFYPHKTYLSPFRVPESIVEYLEKYPVSGNMFNSIRFGGYIIWKCYPDKKVYIDGRLIIRTPEYFSEYIGLLDNYEKFMKAARQWDITHVIMPIAIFDRYTKLAVSLYKSNMWDLVFTDGGSVLFVRHDINTHGVLDLSVNKDFDRINQSINDQWKNDPYIREEAIGYLNNFLKTLGIKIPTNFSDIKIIR